MQPEQIIALINLLNVSGIGPRKARSLVNIFKHPSAIFQQSITALCQADGVELKSAEKIRNQTDFDCGARIFDRTAALGAKIITFWDERYPKLLKKIYDPPVLLYIIGQELEAQEDAIAIVGTRNITPYGRATAEVLARELSQAGLIVVSGLARGIDTVAHQATVSAGGRTIAVLGSGLDYIYPSENRKLASQIVENGTILTEFPPGTKPDAGNFPQRNRIISGLSHATIVVEAGDRSGAILTALNSIDQNRDVFAVPGRITDRQSVGCLRLITHGAIPVTSSDKVIEVLEARLFKPRTRVQQELKLDLTNEEREVYDCLSHEPIHIDDLTERTGLEITTLLTILLQLELKQFIVQLSGKNFVLA